MIEPLSHALYSKVLPLFTAIDFHLAALSVLGGASPGSVYVDNTEHPRSALVRALHRFHLAGDPQNAAFNQALHQHFIENIFPRSLEKGEEAFSLYYAPGWKEPIENEVLCGVDPIPGQREYYELIQPHVVEGEEIPENIRLAPVDRLLMEDPHLSNLDWLREEMQSERESPDAFLDHSFGMCLRSEDQIITWCLSEYNFGQRCEVGIATHPDYHRRGLATATGKAFIRQAQEHGIQRIGWHCAASNTGSSATARKIGFHKAHDYPSFLVFFDRGLHLAVRGNINLEEGAYHEAFTWLERAIQQKSHPDWVYLSAACSAARLEKIDLALRYLKATIARGFDDPQQLGTIDHLQNLHHLPEWQELVRPS